VEDSRLKHASRFENAEKLEFFRILLPRMELAADLQGEACHELMPRHNPLVGPLGQSGLVIEGGKSN
jgi:hypothetical protein